MTFTTSTHNPRRLRTLQVALLAAVCASPALATNGYFSHGYGIKAKGMGGASVAMTDDAFGGANNPASSAWAGNRMEIGVDIFMPKRGMERSGLGAVDSDSNTFYVPEFGYNRKLDDKWGVGLTVYGNGGLNTDYPGGQIPPGGCTGSTVANNVLCGVGRMGIDMMQLIVAPTVAYKFDSNQSVGVSPLFVQQIFKADGLDGFAQMTPSNSTSKLTGNGYDNSNGIGLRLGYLGKFGNVAVGVSYAPKIAMSKLSKYSELFADGGNFDIPANYTVGLAFKATPDVTVAVDYQRIQYSGVVSVNNPSTNIMTAQLGATNAAGFGWNDINTWKLGAEWKVNNAWTVRGGVNFGQNPIDSRDVTFNILAPGVVTTHYTVGATYAMSKQSEVSFSYMNAPSNSVSGANLLQPTATDTIHMSQQSLGVQFGWKF